MPTLPVIAVYYISNCVKLKYADNTSSEWYELKDFPGLCGSIDKDTWLTLKIAIESPGKWIEVK